MFKVFLTSGVTIISGVLIFIIGQVLLKLIIEPIHELNQVRGDIADSLIYYANIYMNLPLAFTDLSEAKKRDEAQKTFREESSRLCSKAHFISKFKIWELLGIVPKLQNMMDAAEELIRLSNSIHGGEANFNNISREKISSLLDIKLKLERQKGKSMNNKVEKIMAREGLIITGLFVTGIMPRLLNMFKVFLCELQHQPVRLSDIPGGETLGQVMNSGLRLLLIIYPIYLIIRFVIWAIKTLKMIPD